MNTSGIFGSLLSKQGALDYSALYKLEYKNTS